MAILLTEDSNRATPNKQLRKGNCSSVQCTLLLVDLYVKAVPQSTPQSSGGGGGGFWLMHSWISTS